MAEMEINEGLSLLAQEQILVSQEEEIREVMCGVIHAYKRKRTWRFPLMVLTTVSYSLTTSSYSCKID